MRQVQIKSIFRKYVLQSRHGRFLWFHLLILALNSDNDLVCFKSNVNVSQSFGSKELKLCTHNEQG